MTTEQGRGRGRRGRRNGETRNSAALGSVRRAQLITTYGVGSMIAIGDRSFLVGGLDSWRVDERYAIREPRLQRRLHTREFRLPPASDRTRGDGVGVRLFPEWYSCPECHRLQEFRRFGSPRGRSECGDCGRPLVPSRFLLACTGGHLTDFPYFAWVHKQTGEPTGEQHELELHSTGRSAALSAVRVRCSCGKEASLEGAFGRKAMWQLGIKCSGARPWLGRGNDESGCDQAPRTLQRGASAAWFPVVRSGLSIPPWSQTLQKLIEPHYGMIQRWLGKRDRPEVLDRIEDIDLVHSGRFSAEDVLAAVERRMALEVRTEDEADPDPLEAASDFRQEEYEQLITHTPAQDRDDDFECVPPPGHEASSPPAPIGRVMQVKRLREVRVQQSFTRVEPPDAVAGTARRCAMAVQETDWLPAMEVSGEGVFLTMGLDRLRDWERREPVRDRATRIRDRHSTVLRRHAGKPSNGIAESTVGPRFVLLHTLAHVLINEWSMEAGYPAASLRERLYVSGEMAGVLIYTATSDSAGSLGGVVAQAEYERLGASLGSALERACWCSQDPPCMESASSGVDGLNLAACYACVLLPETSCEHNNTLLDRGLLVGTTEHPEVGFFVGG